MDCIDARKKLKDYAAGKIDDKALMENIELHVAGCPLCKRELLMWQEVADRQELLANMSRNMPGTLKDRVEKRMKAVERDISLPPVIRRMEAMRRFTVSPLVKKIFTVLMLAAAGILMYVASSRGVYFPAVILFIAGTAVVVILSFRKNKR